MLKKAIACLLVLAGVCSFHTSAADSKNEQFVNVNVFNKVYYGTVTKNADAGEAIFTPAGKSADFLQIEGRWDDDAFSGDCVISYKDGESAEVQYKDGLIIFNYVRSARGAKGLSRFHFVSAYLANKHISPANIFVL